LSHVQALPACGLHASPVNGAIGAVVEGKPIISAEVSLRLHDLLLEGISG
jgi:hypothetical protein